MVYVSEAVLTFFFPFSAGIEGPGSGTSKSSLPPSKGTSVLSSWSLRTLFTVVLVFVGTVLAFWAGLTALSAGLVLGAGLNYCHWELERKKTRKQVREAEPSWIRQECSLPTLNLSRSSRHRMNSLFRTSKCEINSR